MTQPYSIVSSTLVLSIRILSSRGALGRSYSSRVYLRKLHHALRMRRSTSIRVINRLLVCRYMHASICFFCSCCGGIPYQVLLLYPHFTIYNVCWPSCYNNSGSVGPLHYSVTVVVLIVLLTVLRPRYYYEDLLCTGT